ncbi:MAG: membrane protein insertase YidC [Flavobacteriaceae bacterium]|nr:membrane protein insertase YidC [Flavobacteriaceae bacterium]
MEDKKFDTNSIIGFVMIGVIFIWMLYNNQPTEEELLQQQQEQVDNPPQIPQQQTQKPVSTEQVLDSVGLAAQASKLGSFAYSATLAKATDFTTLENDVMSLKVSNKGGFVIESKLKDFHTYNQKPVYLIKDGNADFNLSLQTTDNRTLQTRDLVFQPTLTTQNGNQILSMRLKVSENQFLEYRYALRPGDHMLDFSIRSQGLENVLNSATQPLMLWQMKTYRYAKSVSYENRYSELLFEYEGGKDDWLNAQSESTDDTAKDVTWVAYKQHFFTNILLTDTPFENANFRSENLVKDEVVDTLFTKRYTTTAPLKLTAGNLSYNMNWYFGPSDYKILNTYDRNLDEVIPLGWGLFGWINRYLFIPFFTFLSNWLPHGIAIIIMTIVVRILMSPVTYKSYLSQAKMKVIRPEITEINEKFKKDAMKRQQETMKLYSKAGVNPMAGCIPAVMQIPIFYALFMFFPSTIELRQKPFLWADDLSSYDTIFKLPFHIPFYGDHVSLFPILASVAIFFYMQMTTGQQMMSQPTQEGMPDMGKIMKIMMYLSPIMMLFFFNNYASGLSLYYFVSNLITILIMLVIKYRIIDEAKIHAKIQENKLKPRKVGKFQQKMQQMMEEAEKQKKNKR